MISISTQKSGWFTRRTVIDEQSSNKHTTQPQVLATFRAEVSGAGAGAGAVLVSASASVLPETMKYAKYRILDVYLLQYTGFKNISGWLNDNFRTDEHG